MAIREDLVASATQFLQDPSVASSSVENRVTFLRSKNLTQEEIDVALARTGGAPAPSSSPYPPQAAGPPQGYYPPYPPQQAWQPPPEPPRRDWRDWFIMATVVGGVSYGLYSLGKRYVYPLVAPPTPEKLEQDKKSIEEQFDRAFSLVEQLAKDTEDLKAAEKTRTERLDTALADLDTVMSDLKTANRRREDDAQKIRDEVQALKDAIPKAMTNQKDLTDKRLREINTELGSLKTLVAQRMAAPTPTPSSNPLRSMNGGSTPAVPTTRPETPQAAPATGEEEKPKEAETPAPAPAPKKNFNFSNGNAGGKASIPAWQMAMQNKSATPASGSEGASNSPNSGP